ncbi:MAG TPA: hypothetical protein VG892_10555 [Terriglobales bacterium]|nr:hypothetical protein [Terriglobales bacterium]
MAFRGAIPVLGYLSCDPARLAEVQEMLYLGGLRFNARLLKRPWETPLQLPEVDVFVVDALQDMETTLSLTSEVIRASGERPVLLMSEDLKETLAFAALSANVQGLMRYSELQQQLSQAIQVLANGGFWIPRTVLFRFLGSSLAVARRSRFALSRAELDENDTVLLDMVLNRYSDEQIASKMHMPPEEVQAKVKSILETFGVRRRDDLLLLADQRTITAQVE